jgi:hypothetical protein
MSFWERGLSDDEDLVGEPEQVDGVGGAGAFLDQRDQWCDGGHRHVHAPLVVEEPCVVGVVDQRRDAPTTMTFMYPAPFGESRAAGAGRWGHGERDDVSRSSRIPAWARREPAPPEWKVHAATCPTPRRPPTALP